MGKEVKLGQTFGSRFRELREERNFSEDYVVYETPLDDLEELKAIEGGTIYPVPPEVVELLLELLRRKSNGEFEKIAKDLIGLSGNPELINEYDFSKLNPY